MSAVLLRFSRPPFIRETARASQTLGGTLCHVTFVTLIFASHCVIYCSGQSLSAYRYPKWIAYAAGGGSERPRSLF